MDLLFSQSQSAQGGGLLSFLPFLLIMAILYFFMLRPQAKKQKDKLVAIKVDNNTILTLSKSSIAGLYGKTNEEDLK